MYDTPEDTTRPYLEKYARRDPRSSRSRTPTAAARRVRCASGSSTRSRTSIVVTMADGSDDPQQIDQLTHLVERGVVVAAASRYMHGGQQVGGPVLKSTLVARSRASRCTGSHGSERVMRRTRSRRTTPSSSARSASSPTPGFELGIELVAKARRRRLPVAEIPTIWLDRLVGSVELQGSRRGSRATSAGTRFAFGPQITVAATSVGNEERVVVTR